jgi:Pentapeptide repeats (8 copies)
MVDSSVVGYDGARKVRDEEQSVGRKKRVRKAEPSKRPPKQRAQSEQKPRSRWQSIKNQVVRTAKVAAGPLITVLDLVVVLSAISMIWLLWRDVITVPVTNYYGLRGVLTVGGILILIGIGYRYEWTGFVARDREKSETGEIQRRKTLWDWMTLLLVPVMIAGIAPWFTLWQNNSQRTLEAQQRAQEAENRAQSAALQDYLGQMSQLIKEDGLQQSDEGDTVFTLAQARTITTIRQLDGGRNQIVTRFLTELGLLRVPALLAKVNLEGAELAKAELQEANLVGTQLNRANLAGALLINADFSAENQIIQAN